LNVDNVKMDRLKIDHECLLFERLQPGRSWQVECWHVERSLL
jgi:hypothetical protein